MLSEHIPTKLPQLAADFARARPFRHVVIDQFLEPARCAQLLADFPSFETRYALDETGRVGGKAVRMDLPDISAHYAALHDLLRSPTFIGQLEQLTGIPELLFDPSYIGGGTHENIEGQGLEQHVDFNILPHNGWHRRLNLILYLNPVWQEDWGGCLDLELDSWTEPTERVRVLPLMNRCVVFETTESSWHGFDTIRLPPGSTVSRKSIAVYYYTKAREAAQIAPSHGTVYVPRGMPQALAVGQVLTAADIDLLSARFQRLRGQLKFLYDRELTFSDQLQRANDALAEARAASGFPLQGFVLLEGGASGYWPDGWCARSVRLTFCPTRSARRLRLALWIPPQISLQHATLRAGEAVAEGRAAGGQRVSLEIGLAFKAGSSCNMELDLAHEWRPSSEGSGDLRPLAAKLVEALLE